MVLALVAGAVVGEDGSAWVWGRRKGRHAPRAASSAALGVAISRGGTATKAAVIYIHALGPWDKPRGVARLCALDGAVRGHRPWWAVWVWRWAVAVTFGVAAFGVAISRGGTTTKAAVIYIHALGPWDKPRGVARVRGGVGWSCDCGDCCARGDEGDGGAGGGGGDGDGDGDGGGDGEGDGDGEWEESGVDGGEWEVGVGACGRCVAWAAAHRAVGP